MDDRPYMGLWYRVVGDGYRRWHFTIMSGPGGRPIDHGEIRGSQIEAAVVAKSRIAVYQRTQNGADDAR